MRRRGGVRARTVGALALAALACAAEASAQTETGQGPPITELRRLAGERESRIDRLVRDLTGLEARQDSLVRVKARTEPGSAQFDAVSNRIRELSLRIQPLQRDLTDTREQLRDLRNQLFLRYTREIGAITLRVEELKAGGFTPQTSAEMRRLIDRSIEYQRARRELQGLLEEVRAELALPTLAYDPTDDPRELRAKLATARDGIALLDSLIGLVDEDIEEIQNELRVRREARQLRQDLEFWGDDRSTQSADELGAILDQGGVVAIGAEDPEERLRRLRVRRAELVERREEYERKIALFDQQLREFYR